MTNEVSTAVSFITDAVRQMQQWPVAVLIIAVLVVAGSMMKSMELFPNRLIPVSVIIFGGVLNGLLGDVASISFEQRFPTFVLGLQGVLFGFAAWAIHGLVLKRFEKYVPFLAGKSGDTMFIKRPKITEDKETKDTTIE